MKQQLLIIRPPYELRITPAERKMVTTTGVELENVLAFFFDVKKPSLFGGVVVNNEVYPGVYLYNQTIDGVVHTVLSESDVAAEGVFLCKLRVQNEASFTSLMADWGHLPNYARHKQMELSPGRYCIVYALDDVLSEVGLNFIARLFEANEE